MNKKCSQLKTQILAARRYAPQGFAFSFLTYAFFYISLMYRVFFYTAGSAIARFCWIIFYKAIKVYGEKKAKNTGILNLIQHLVKFKVFHLRFSGSPFMIISILTHIFKNFYSKLHFCDYKNICRKCFLQKT